MRAAAVALVMVAMLCGCSSASRGEVEHAARSFFEATAAGNLEQACALLSTEAVRMLERTTKEGCVRVLGIVQLPRSSTVRTTDVFGGNARVVTDADTMFLSEYDDGWRVTAAGCQEREDLPYACLLGRS